MAPIRAHWLQMKCDVCKPGQASICDLKNIVTDPLLNLKDLS